MGAPTTPLPARGRRAPLSDPAGWADWPAAHADEFAARLEASGLNDRSAQRLDRPDLFAYAEELYAARPPLPALPTPLPAVPWSWRSLGRGLMYALPGAAALLAGPWLVAAPGALGRALGLALVVALMFSWGWTQGQAVAASRLGAPGRLAFLRRAALLALPVGGGLGAFVVALASPQAGGLDLLQGALVTGLSAGSLSAAGALLTLGYAPVLVIAYLPAAAALLSPVAGFGVAPQAELGALAWAALLPPAALVALSPHPEHGDGAARAPWSLVSGYALAGWLGAAFVLLAWGVGGQAGALALLPLILSLGLAELVGRACRQDLRARAALAPSLRAARARAWRGILAATLLYEVALLGLLGLVGTLSGRALPELWGLWLPALLYGAALLLGILQSSDTPWWSVAAWGLGAGVVAALFTAPDAWPSLPSWAAGVPLAPTAGALTALLVSVFGLDRALREPYTYL